MNSQDMPHNPFSLIADYEGDIKDLFKQEIGQTLPILPLRNMVLFPGVVTPVMIGRESSMRLIEFARDKDELIGVVTQQDGNIDNPRENDLFKVGVVAKVVRVLEMPDGGVTVILQSFGRFRLLNIADVKPFLWANVKPVKEVLPGANDKEFSVMTDTCRDLCIKYLQTSDAFREESSFAVKNISNPIFMVNFICTNLPFDLTEKIELLEEGNQKKRTSKLISILYRECQYAQLKESIQNKTRADLDQQQREYFLQQQIKNIQNELGGSDNADSNELRKKAEKANMPQNAREIFDKELAKLERINPQVPDYNVQLNYLQTLVSLPWGKMSKDNLNLVNAKKILNKDHYGMERVKDRILEYLASISYRKTIKAPIICLYGPPGVGKTSLGKSIAKALERKYVRVSLGGVHDEAEIRGHRRTYIGAMPGRILKSLIKAETNNPVFVLDEIDKISQNNYNGDPQSALLEVLDPEQNNAFHDNFLDIDYDLSNVMFIATANTLSTIPSALLDRMEIIEVEGYLTEEKKEIARRHLIPKELKKYRKELADCIKLPMKSIEYIIEKYTRESGVRGLEKQIEKIVRKISLKKALAEDVPLDSSIDIKTVETLLGKPPYNRDKYQGNDYAGVVTGLAWTSVGGEILFIESGACKSKNPTLTLTGNLGDVMKESAVIALEYVKAHAADLGIDYRIFEQWSIHVHVPEGATPKDGPSAGITIATSIASALTQRKIRKQLAMTGEITLRGKVLPVGGIKEKILAAKRAGVTEIIISKENEKDIEEINEKYLAGLSFHYVENVSEVFDYALLDEKVARPIVFDVSNNDSSKILNN